MKGHVIIVREYERKVGYRGNRSGSGIPTWVSPGDEIKNLRETDPKAAKEKTTEWDAAAKKSLLSHYGNGEPKKAKVAKVEPAQDSMKGMDVFKRIDERIARFVESKGKKYKRMK